MRNINYTEEKPALICHRVLPAIPEIKNAYIRSITIAASLKMFPNGGSRIIQQARQNNHHRHSRILGNNDINILLDDLDNQTEAIKNGQEIGNELLDAQTKKSSKDKKVALSGKNSVGMLASINVKITKIK